MMPILASLSPSHGGSHAGAGRAKPGKSADLRVVQPAETSRSVGAIGSFVAILVFVTLLAVASLHAVLVQTQAGIDDRQNAINDRHDRIAELTAEIARLDAPAGVAELAAQHGLVAATDTAQLAEVAPGALPPPGENPFGPHQ